MTFEQWWEKWLSNSSGVAAGLYDYKDLRAAFEAGYVEGKDVGWEEGKRDTDEMWMDSQ